MQYKSTTALLDLIERQKKQIKDKPLISSKSISNLQITSQRTTLKLDNNYNKSIKLSQNKQNKFKSPLTLPNLMNKMLQPSNSEVKPQGANSSKTIKLKLLFTKPNTKIQKIINSSQGRPMTHLKQRDEMQITFGDSFQSKQMIQNSLQEVKSTSRVMSRSQKRLVERIFN